jgi:hypothetical protein
MMKSLSIEERIDAAIEYGMNMQGAFMDDELYKILKEEEVSKAFYEHIDECSGCGRIWPLDSMEDGKQMDGLLCFYCVDDEENE